MVLDLYPEIDQTMALKRRGAGRMLLEAGQYPMSEEVAAKRTASTFKAVAMEWHCTIFRV